MAFLAKRPEGQDIDPIPAGTVQAVCYAVVDLGTQFSEYYNKSARKVQIMWEIPEYRIDVERAGQKVDMPRAISKRYTLSLHKKAQLYNDLVAWRGVDFTDEELNGFDIFSILGVNCLLTITHGEKDKKVYANIASVAKLMKDMDSLKSENGLVRYYMPEDQQVIPESVPDWLVDIIKKSEEFKMVADAREKLPPEYGGREPGDDVPF